MANTWNSDGTLDGAIAHGGQGDAAKGITALLSNAQNGDIITLPASGGPFHWTTTLVIDKMITLKGLGIGTDGTNNGPWGTNVVRDVNGHLIQVKLPAGARTYPPWDDDPTKIVRITGINFIQGTGTGGTQLANNKDPHSSGGTILFAGYDQRTDAQFRFDHCGWQNLDGEFNHDTATGLVDHNYVRLWDTVPVQNPWVYPKQGWWQTQGADNTVAPWSYNNPQCKWSDGSAADGVRWGSTEFVYFEYNTIDSMIKGHYGVCDSFYGGRTVWRFNKMIDVGFQTHGTEGSGPGRGHGHRAWEIYGNNLVCRASYPTTPTAGTPDSATLILERSGTGPVYNNVSQPASTAELAYHNPRISLQSYRYYLNPFLNGWMGSDGISEFDVNSGPYATGTMNPVSNSLTVTVATVDAGSLWGPVSTWGPDQAKNFTIRNPDLPRNTAQLSFMVIEGSTNGQLTLHAPFSANQTIVFWDAAHPRFAIYQVEHGCDGPGWGQGAILDSTQSIAVPPISWQKGNDPRDKQDQVLEKIYAWNNQPKWTVFPSFLKAEIYSGDNATVMPLYTALGPHPLADPTGPTITDSGCKFNSDAAADADFTVHTSGFTNPSSITWAVPIVTEAPISPPALPAHVAFNTTTGTFSGTASGATVGNYKMTLTANATGPTQSVTKNDFTLEVSFPHTGPTVTITQPSNNQVFNTPVDITLTANPLPGDSPIAKVEFYRGGTTLIPPAVTASPWSIVWTAVPIGPYVLTAKVYDTFNPVATATSPAINISVQAPVIASPTIVVSASRPEPPVTPGQGVIFWGHEKVNSVSNPSFTANSDGAINSELQDMWNVGGRCVRIDVDQANNFVTGGLGHLLSLAKTIGFQNFVLIYKANILFSGLPNTGTWASGAATLAAANTDCMIELGNEPNLDPGPSNAGMTAQQYATLAIAAYAAIKGTANAKPVLLGGIGNGTSVNGGLSPYFWVNTLVTNGCTLNNAFDWANYHNYGEAVSAEAFWHFYTLQGSTGDPRTPANQSCQNRFGNPPFAMTEFGEALSFVTSPSDTPGKEAVQATYCTGWMQAFKAQPNCRLASWFALADDFGFGGSPTGFGLRRMDTSHRPAWDNYLAQATS